MSVGRVLAAIDATPAGRAVLGVAPRIGALFDADVDAVHVLENGGGAARAMAEEARIPLRCREGSVEEVLTLEGAAPDVEAIVIGTRGAQFGRRPAGHVALHLSGALPRPLVLVPPESATDYRLARILVPLDGSVGASESVRGLLAAASERNLDVEVLHVRDEAHLPAYEDHPRYEIQAWADEFVARHCPPESQVRLQVRVGVPAEEILRVAGESRVDLVVLGWSQDLTGDRGPVVREVLKRSVVPIVLLPVPVSIPIPDPETPAGGGPAGAVEAQQPS
jgi:nucleotide-binding universal stress UspA family protein